MQCLHVARVVRLSLVLSAALGLGACGGGSPRGPAQAPSPRAPEFDFAPSGAIPDGELGDYHVILECSIGNQSAGEMAFVLWPGAAPGAVRRFLRLADGGWYDGSSFDRVVREFVLQGGVRGDGSGPFGMLPPERGYAPAHEHHYGVLGMTLPPSMRFFICVAESPKVWALDRQQVYQLGMLARGVACLETLASTPTALNPQGERSLPLGSVELTRARVVRGPPEREQPIQRPRPDLGGQPERVGVQHIRITFLERAGASGVQRNRLQARELVQRLYAELTSGASSWAQVARQSSDDPLPAGASEPPLRRITNYGVVDIPGQRAKQDATVMFNAHVADLAERFSRGELTSQKLQESQQERARELAEWVMETAVDRREDINAVAYAEAAFGLQVGEICLVPYDRFTCPGGWYLLRRVE